MVSTLDFESSDPSSNLGETFFFSGAQIFFLLFYNHFAVLYRRTDREKVFFAGANGSIQSGPAANE